MSNYVPTEEVKVPKNFTSLEEVIAKAKKLHGNTYEYTCLIRNAGQPLKVECVCAVHGTFVLRAARHYTEGCGCPKCATTTSLEEFKNRAIEKHGDKYDYSKVQFTTLKDHVTIGCPIHGDFVQKANDHLLYYGCGLCGIIQRAKTNTKTTEWFVAKAIDVHGNMYDYSKSVYTKAAKKLIICCPEHGEFTQQAIAHLSGQGCPLCGIAKVTAAKRNEPDKNGWSYHNWELAGNSSPLFDGFKLYLIECWNSINGERFVKLGKTYTTLANRFRGANMPYEWTVLQQVQGPARYISELEAELHRTLKQNGYAFTPSQMFNGKYECYNTKCVKELNGKL